MKTFKQYVSEMKYRPNDPESSNVEDMRAASTPAPKRPLQSIVDRAKALSDWEHKYDQPDKHEPYSPSPEAVNKTISLEYQHAIKKPQ